MTAISLYVGTFPRAYHSDSEDSATGIYGWAGREAEYDLVEVMPAIRPGWLTWHPSRRYLYAVNEVRSTDGHAGGSVTAYSIHPETGSLSELNRRPTGPSPCHAAVDATGRMLLVSSFHGSTVHAFALDADGQIGPETDTVAHVGSSIHPRQTEPHPHAVTIDRGNRFVIVPDLGTDRVEVYGLDVEKGVLIRRPEAGATLPPGSGPRHVAIHPTGAWVFVVNEISATVTTMSYDDASGNLSVVSVVPVLPEGVSGYRSAAEIVVDSSGRFVYVTHRSHGSSGPRPEGGEDCVAWFAVDAATGRLRPEGRVPSGGAIPRSCVFREGGAKLLVAHQGSSTIVEFNVDRVTGALTRSGRVVASPVPVCLLSADLS